MFYWYKSTNSDAAAAEGEGGGMLPLPEALLEGTVDRVGDSAGAGCRGGWLLDGEPLVALAPAFAAAADAAAVATEPWRSRL